MRKPLITYFCPNSAIRKAGASAITAVAAIRFQRSPISVTNCAITTVIIGTRLPVKISANRNSFQVNSQHSTASAEIAGSADGTATRMKAPHRVQPSIMAAYSIDGSMPSKKPFISQEKKQMCTAACGRSGGRISHSPGRANAKQMSASASANGVLRPMGGSRGRNAERFTRATGSRFCDGVDRAIEHHADHEDEEPADDGGCRTTAEI